MVNFNRVSGRSGLYTSSFRTGPSAMWIGPAYI